MLTRNDLLLLLKNLSDQGVDTKAMSIRVAKSSTVDLQALKFVNDRQTLDIVNFYEKIRKSYNQKKSKLYINIMKEVEDPKNCLTTLSSMLTQILLYAERAEDRQSFIKHARVDEICAVLMNYFRNFDLTQATSLLHLIKADIKAFESINSLKGT